MRSVRQTAYRQSNVLRKDRCALIAIFSVGLSPCHRHPRETLHLDRFASLKPSLLARVPYALRLFTSSESYLHSEKDNV
jgi:hypothetical protein